MADQGTPREPIARRAYSSFADRYSAFAPTKAHNALYERPATMSLLGEVAGLRVLDAGCGPGICSEIMARDGATVHGFDVTPEMVDLARERCRGLATDFRIADLEGPLDWLADESFDKVLCSLVLDYVEELAPALRELRRVTRPGGILAFSLGHPMGDWLIEEIRGDSSYYDRSRHGMHWSGFGDPEPYVESYRRPLAEILNAIADAGWAFDRAIEPRPTPEIKAASERIYAALSFAPAFLCIRATR